MNYRRSSGRDWVPVLPTPGPVPVSEWELIPSDNRYGFLTGNSDPIYSFGDVIPEMMVGHPGQHARRGHGGREQAGQVRGRRRDRSRVAAPYGALVRRRVLGRQFLRRRRQHERLLLPLAGAALRRAEREVRVHHPARRRSLRRPTSTSSTCAGTSRTSRTRRRRRATPAAPDRAATRTYTHATVTPILFDRLNAGVSWWNYQATRASG